MNNSELFERMSRLAEKADLDEDEGYVVIAFKGRSWPPEAPELLNYGATARGKLEWCVAGISRVMAQIFAETIRDTDAEEYDLMEAFATLIHTHLCIEMGCAEEEGA